MTKTMSDYCKLRLQEGGTCQYNNAIDELLFGSYFSMELWSIVLALDMKNSPSLAEFINNGVSAVDTADLSEVEIEVLKGIFLFLSYREGIEYAKAIRNEFRDFANSEITMKQYYTNHDMQYKKADRYEGYRMKEKTLFGRVADYLDEQVIRQYRPWEND